MEKDKDILAQLKKQKQPEVPVNYFEELNTKLLSEIKKEPKAKVVPIKRTAIFWMSTAAAAIIVLISVYNMRPVPAKETINFSALTSTEIENYIHSNIDDFDEALIVEVMEANSTRDEKAILTDTIKKTSKKETNTLSKEENIGEVSFENLTREDILKYLKQQEMSEEELEEEIEN